MLTAFKQKRPWRLQLNALRRSLRVRLMLGTLIWIGFALIATGFMLTSFFKEHATRQFQAMLEVHLNQLSASFEVNDQGQPFISSSLSDPRFTQPLSGLYWQVSDQQYVAVLRSRSLWDDALTLPHDMQADGHTHTLTTTALHGSSLRAAERRVKVPDHPDQAWYLVVAANANDLEHAIGDWVRMLSIFLAVLFISLSAAAIAQVRVGLAPLRSLQSALHRLRGGSLERLEGQYPQEIEPLIDDFNSVLDHSVQVVTRARAQTGDLAHAIKTPLTILANAAARDIHLPGPTGDLARLVAEQANILQHQVAWRLKHARTAATISMLQIRTPIEPVLEQLVRVMKRLHADRQIKFLSKVYPQDLIFRGETQDLQEILGNILDNACKWAKSSISIDVSTAHQTIRIVIDDDGPGLRAGQHDEVMKRGVRADEQVPGSGLGLSIAKDLIDMYGGELILEQSPAGGLRVELRF